MIPYSLFLISYFLHFLVYSRKTAKWGIKLNSSFLYLYTNDTTGHYRKDASGYQQAT